jgi:hypothetical protein
MIEHASDVFKHIKTSACPFCFHFSYRYTADDAFIEKATKDSRKVSQEEGHPASKGGPDTKAM